MSKSNVYSSQRSSLIMWAAIFTGILIILFGCVYIGLNWYVDYASILLGNVLILSGGLVAKTGIHMLRDEQKSHDVESFKRG